MAMARARECTKCGYSKSGLAKDKIRICLDCGTVWPVLEMTMDEAYADIGRKPKQWPAIPAATRRGPALPDVWRIVDVPETAWTEDPCGISGVINWILPQDIVRIDLITTQGGRPIVSFQGSTDNVRKHTMQWLAKYVPTFDLAHAAYIGAELERADTERIDFVQDGKAEVIHYCGHCGKSPTTRYIVDEYENVVYACKDCVTAILGDAAEYNKCRNCLTARSLQDVSEICSKCDKPDVKLDEQGRDKDGNQREYYG